MKRWLTLGCWFGSVTLMALVAPIALMDAAAGRYGALVADGLLLLGSLGWALIPVLKAQDWDDDDTDADGFV